ncbi:MAG: YcxB family protein [Leptonema illini]|jgi:hypothetical protein|uniref:YcxB family protein n=1 Tax=Leptonema illini TaxID=183 RepID=A0A833LYJ2_9LEPT|nr:MAG: YcxB family protein [Leptonema illini]
MAKMHSSHTYENSPEDFVAFNKYHHRRIWYAFDIFFAVAMIAASIKMIMTEQITVIGSIFSLLPFILAYAVLRLFMSLLSTLILNISYKRKGNKGAYFGTLEIACNEKGITEKTSLRESTFGWNAINKIVRTKRHFLIYVSPFAAIIVPVNSFPSTSDADRWLTDLQSMQSRFRSLPL